VKTVAVTALIVVADVVLVYKYLHGRFYWRVSFHIVAAIISSTAVAAMLDRTHLAPLFKLTIGFPLSLIGYTALLWTVGELSRGDLRLAMNIANPRALQRYVLSGVRRGSSL